MPRRGIGLNEMSGGIERMSDAPQSPEGMRKREVPHVPQRPFCRSLIATPIVFGRAHRNKGLVPAICVGEL